jgi:hypothetical protein
LDSALGTLLSDGMLIVYSFTGSSRSRISIRFGLDEQLRSDTPEYPSSEYPTLKLVRKWYGGVAEKHENGVPLEEEKYGPLKRIRRRYGEYLLDPEHDKGIAPRRVPIKELSFEPLRSRG